jgi:hypothetical protein
LSFVVVVTRQGLKDRLKEVISLFVTENFSEGFIIIN